MIDQIIAYTSWSSLAKIALVLIIAKIAVSAILEDIKIRRLGGRAARKATRAPFGRLLVRFGEPLSYSIPQGWT